MCGGHCALWSSCAAFRTSACVCVCVCVAGWCSHKNTATQGCAQHLLDPLLHWSSRCVETSKGPSCFPRRCLPASLQQPRCQQPAEVRNAGRRKPQVVCHAITDTCKARDVLLAPTVVMPLMSLPCCHGLGLKVSYQSLTHAGGWHSHPDGQLLWLLSWSISALSAAGTQGLAPRCFPS